MDLASLVQKFPLEVWRFELPERMVLGWWEAVAAQAAGSGSESRVWADDATATHLRTAPQPVQASPLKGAANMPSRALILARSDFVFFSCIDEKPGKHRCSTVWWTFSPAALQLWLDATKTEGIRLPEKSIEARLPLICLALLLRQIENVCAEAELMRSQLQELHEKVLHIQKMENIGLLARNIGHDLNNLLSPISGYSQFLVTDLTADSPLRRYAELIEKAAIKSEALVQQLLNYAPVEKIQFANVDLRSLVDESLSVLAKTLALKQIKTRVDLPNSRCDVEVIPDKILEALVLSELNAFEASPPGGIIEIGVRQVITDDAFKEKHSKASRPAYYQVTIKDQGLGLPPETLAKAYDPFFTTKMSGPGVGLGLPITDGIIRYHKGFTELSSALGHGAEFRIFIPATPRPQTTEKTPIRRPRPTAVQNAGDTLLVLLVEDEPPAQEVIAALLERRNCRVTVAGTGEEALKLLKADGKRFDLILLDIVMPGIGGYQTFLQMQELDLDVPVILSTGYAKDWHVTEMLRLGVLGILRKPYTLDELSNMLELVRPSKSPKGEKS